MLAPRIQGDVGELSAIVWLAGQGYPVFKPLFHSPHYDLVADLGDRLVRIEVKTTTQWRRGRWDVTVCTRGGNQSWNGLTKRLDAATCETLHVLRRDGRRWFIPSTHFGGGRGLRLGGPKYAAFEVDRGDPIPEARISGPPLQSASSPARGDVRAAKGEAL
jgi:Holliday junction resolvase-like predicted endonuclease